MFSFKRADESEAYLIKEIAQQVWPDTYKDILSEAQLHYMFDKMYNEDELGKQIKAGILFYFVYLNDKIAGFASLQTIDVTTTKLDKIYIVPENQGSGAGKALLSFITNKARSLGALQLILNVNRKNKARFFYEKMGFSIREEKDISIGNGYFMNDYIMALDLQML